MSDNNTNNSERSKQEELEKEIKESIEELKKRDEKVWPEKKYVKALIKEPFDRQKEKKIRIKDYVMFAVVALLLTVVMALAFQQIILNAKKIAEPPTQPTVTEKGFQAVHDIEFKIEDCYIEEETLFVKLNISNKSKNNFYTTVRSMHLIDKDGKEYLPNVDKGSIPTNFYGRRIEPQTEVNALIAFDGFTEIGNKLTLVVNNASDAYHFIWDYMITLPEK